MVFLIRGAQGFERYDTTLFTVVVGYFAAGIFGGLVFGLGLPAARWLPGAAILGFLTASVLWLTIGRTVDPGATLVETLKSSLLLGAAFGIPIGVGMWIQVRRYRRTGRW